MPRRRRLLRIALFACALVLAGGVVLHVFYPLPYVYRVLAWQDADFDDIHHFPASRIAPSAAPVELPVAPAPGVVALFERHPRVERLDALLDSTETSAFLAVHRGRTVLERYLRGHDEQSLQNSFSVSKSLGSALAGLAVRDGAVALDAPITRYVPELQERDPRFAAITVRHLLDMRSGIRFTTEVSFPFFTSDNPLIYYSTDLEAVLLGHTAIAGPPGEFRYNNYNPPLLGLILRRATKMPVSAYLERELWQPLGAAHAAGWTTDDHGSERMESGFHATARDLARFGLLYLRGGKIGDRVVVPADWVATTTSLPEPAGLERHDGRRWLYRLGWWIVPRPTGAADFCAIGRFGQFVYVSPQHDVVFVRTGPGRGDWGDRSWTELFYATAARL